MPHRIIDRAAGNIRISVEARTPEALFADAARALMDLLRPEADPGVAVAERELVIHAPDRTALLVDLLKELLAACVARKEAVQEVVVRHLSNDCIESDIRTVPALSFGEELKGISYKEANVRQRQDGMWETSLIFDV
jgi:SHS2 domain-containing protein